MIKFLIFTFLFSVFTFFQSIAEIISKIEIVGNNRISNETIKIYGEIETGKNYSEADLNSVINNLTQTNFFEDININFENNILKITVKEYPVINQLVIGGEDSKKIKDEIKKLIYSKEKNSFIQSKILNDEEIIKKLYSSIGFNNSKIEIKTKNIDENNLDIFINIERGQKSRISNIIFVGDKKIKDSRLREIIASEEHKFWKILTPNTSFRDELLNLDARLLTNYYKSIGYYDVKITSNTAEINKEGDVSLTYSIDAGQRYFVSKISLNVDPVFDKSLFLPLNKSFNKEIGNYYSPFTIKDLLEEIDQLILDNNLQFVEHEVKEEIENDKILITFNIFESEKILIERINIKGNSITNENVIRGELILDEGDPFSLLNLNKSVSKLKARNIFRDVKSNVKTGSDDNLKVIDIIVEEKATGEIAAGAGVGTNGGTFAFNVTENNWLGEGKKLNFEIDVDEESLRGIVNYSDPNYDFLGNSINYYVSSQSSDRPNQGYENSLVSTGINTSFEQFKDIYTGLGIAASYDELRTQGNASSSLKKQAGDFKEITGNYSFKLDKRDRVFMPTKGFVTSFNQVLPAYADKKFVSNTISLNSYRSLSENVIGSGKIYLTAINGVGDDDVRISKRKFLSTKKLRGFKKGKVGPKDGKDHIGGNYAAAINLEANLPNILPESSRTELGLFLDAGNVWGVDYDSELDESDEIRSSIGAALNWSSPVGPMSFVFSSNLSKANTDETETFNFNLGTTF